MVLRKQNIIINHKTTYKREFSTTSVNQKWTTDVSELQIAEGKLYLSPILDIYNDGIVAYDISAKPNFAQTDHMLDIAFEKYDNLEGLKYHQMLEEKGIQQSMLRKGNCLVNSPMENFFGKMKNKMFYGAEYESLKH